MKLDTTQAILTPDGSAMKDGSGDPATLRSMLMMGLLAGEQSDNGEMKYTKARLAMRIQDNDEVEVDAGEVVMMKKACEILNPWPYMRVCDMIDPKRS